MSGGPQVFLGATTFCLIASPPDLRPPPGFRLPPDLRPPRGLPARETWQPSCARCLVSKPGQALPPPAGTAARPRRPRGGLQSGGAGHDPAGPRRPRDDRLLNNVARNSRASISNTEIASLELQRFEHILKTDRCKLRATFVLADVVASSHR